ncbi:1-acyl-sn-glycerol-3-phosphate acyltransferase [Candidatus Dependentiae bacterium]|nr:1-acyl-sn-glycerol-3-phosphate acyltransferase [Candidatus Dependentiae bacterium]
MAVLLSLGTFIRTGAAYTIAMLIGPFFVIPCMLLALLPLSQRRDNKLFFWLADKFYRLIIHVCFVPSRWIGLENIPQGPVIFAANHQSSLDIPVVGSLCKGYPHIWLVLEYYSHTPIIGFFVRRMFVAVDRQSCTKAARSLIKVIQLVNKKERNLIIFPEGGRFLDGQIHTFFEGFAIIARKTGRPVVPVYMPNNRIIYPPTGFLIYYAPLLVIVGKPFVYSDQDTDELFTQRVRQWFIDQQRG